MPRSLADAGLANSPVFVKLEHVEGQPFYLLGASLREGRFGTEAVLKLRLRDGVYDAEGELQRNVTLSLAAGSDGQRRDIVSYFQRSNDPLGPLMFTRVPSSNGLNDFYRLDDASAEMLAEQHEPKRLEPRESVEPDDAAF
jgi:hypothetical protein